MDNPIFSNEKLVLQQFDPVRREQIVDSVQRRDEDRARVIAAIESTRKTIFLDRLKDLHQKRLDAADIRDRMIKDELFSRAEKTEQLKREKDNILAKKNYINKLREKSLLEIESRRRVDGNKREIKRLNDHKNYLDGLNMRINESRKKIIGGRILAFRKRLESIAHNNVLNDSRMRAVDDESRNLFDQSVVYAKFLKAINEKISSKHDQVIERKKSIEFQARQERAAFESKIAQQKSVFLYQHRTFEASLTFKLSPADEAIMRSFGSQRRRSRKNKKSLRSNKRGSEMAYPADVAISNRERSRRLREVAHIAKIREEHRRKQLKEEFAKEATAKANAERIKLEKARQDQIDAAKAALEEKRRIAQLERKHSRLIRMVPPIDEESLIS